MLHTGIKKRNESGDYVRNVKYTMRKMSVDSNVSYEELLNQIKLEHKVVNKCVLVDLDGQEIDKRTFNLKKLVQEKRHIGNTRLYLAMKPAETAVAPADVVSLSDVERFVSRKASVKQAMEAATDGGILNTSDYLPTEPGHGFLEVNAMSTMFTLAKGKSFGIIQTAIGDFYDLLKDPLKELKEFDDFRDTFTSFDSFYLVNPAIRYFFTNVCNNVTPTDYLGKGKVWEIPPTAVARYEQWLGGIEASVVMF